MTTSVHKTGSVNRTENVRFHPCVFTGKEKDGETGYGYLPHQARQAHHGARYMDHELMTMWLSVDPLADKYPSISPYAYCNWNPVKLVDPDGREIDDYFTREGKYLGSDDANTNYIRIISESTWNNLKDENGDVNHEEACFVSHLFSEETAVMSNDAQLSVYQHYNPTGYTIEADPLEKPSDNPGMRTVVGCKDNDLRKDKATINHLYVRLANNRTPKEDGNALCDNADEIISCFIHEQNHIQRALAMGYKKWFKLNQTKEGKRDVEGSAVAAQRAHSSWNGCGPSFKNTSVS